jgi:DNA invertase Pin-like site-specific DNA recombinase
MQPARAFNPVRELWGFEYVPNETVFAPVGVQIDKDHLITGRLCERLETWKYAANRMRLVWKMDRGFRSVFDAANTLERLRTWGVGLRSYTEPWLDTTSPFGEALYYITVAYAQLERGILRERVKAGMDRARRQGKRIGRPRVTDRRGFKNRFGTVLERLGDGTMSRTKAATELGIGYATLKRLLDAEGATGTES